MVLEIYRGSTIKIFKIALAFVVAFGASFTAVPANMMANEVVSVHFKDINKNDHFYEAVLDLNSRGIVQGYNDGTFKPQNAVTRGETAKFLALALGLNTKNVKNPGFTDVKVTDQFYGPIAALAGAGIINGFSDKKFKPNKLLTRAEMAKILHVGYGFEKETFKDKRFKDVKLGNWYGNYVQTLITHGITKGLTPTSFGPNAFVTRGQIASFIIRSEQSATPVHAEVTTFAGNGDFAHLDSTDLQATFRTPQSLVTLDDGSVLISDRRNQLIRKIKDGDVTTFAGLTLDVNETGLPQGGLHDSEKAKSVFNEPSGMTVDGKGNLYIADANNHVIRKIATNGQVTTVAGNGLIGNQDGLRENSRFYNPQDIAVAKDGTLYIADTLNHVIRKISISGEVSTLNAPSSRPAEVVSGSIEPAGDFQDGKLKDAKFNEPSGLVIDNKGNLYVSDTGNQLIRYIDLSANTVTTVAGNIEKSLAITQSNELYVNGGYADGAALKSRFNFPKGLAITKDNGVLIADSMNHSIRYLLDGKVMTIAGNPQENGYADGKYGHNLLNYPTDVVVRKDGNILVADSYNNRIRQINVDRIVYPSQRSIESVTVRKAEITDLSGTVFITKAGGAKSFRAYNGMKLQQGDRIKTDEYSSVNFKVLDTGDVITIGEKAELIISDLRNKAGKNITRFTVWSGSIWAKVTPLVHSKDAFAIETSAGTMNVRGTNLLVGVDPETGESKFYIASGKGEINKTVKTKVETITIYPTEVLSLDEDTPANKMEDYKNIADLNDLVLNTNDAIIEAIIKSKQAIDQENEEYIENLKQQQNPPSQETIDRVNQNLENLVGNIVKTAIEQKKVDQDEIKTMIDQVNKNLDKKIDLDNVKPVNLSEQEKAKQAQVKLLEEERKKKQEAEKLKQEELKKQNEALQLKLKEQLEKQKAEKEKTQEAAKKKAAEEFAKKLTDDAAKLAFEAKQKAIAAEKQKQEAAAAAEKVRVETPAPTPEPNNETVIDRNLAIAKARVPSDLSVYTEESVLYLKNALKFLERTNDEKVLKTNAINSAVQGLELLPSYPELGASIDGLGDHYVQIKWVEIAGVTYQVYFESEFLREVEGGYFSADELTPGMSYQVEIRGVNSDGQTVTRSVLKFKTHLDPEEYNFDVFSLTFDSITVEWNTLSIENINYQLYLNDTKVATVSGITNSYTFEGIIPGESHTIKIVAYGPDSVEILAVKTYETEIYQ